jgi:transcriptional regulator GlxA family with amidase domain
MDFILQQQSAEVLLRVYLATAVIANDAALSELPFEREFREEMPASPQEIPRPR